MHKLTFAMLVTDEVKPVPATVTVVENWGITTITTEAGLVYGEHMLLAAPEDAFKNWLRPFNGVWIGKGLPALEQFEAMHIE